MFRRHVAAAAAVLILVSSLFAEIIVPGKYCGVVIFDRWGGCTFNHGIYTLYVSEAIKGRLREQAHKCIEIDATELIQHSEDARIQNLKVLGPAPAVEFGASPKGMRIVVAPAFADGQAPEFVVCVENTSQKPLLVDLEVLAPTLLGKRKPAADEFSRDFETADGPTEIVVGDQPFYWDKMQRARKGSGVSNGANCQWTVKQPATLSEDVTIQPKGGFELRVSFALPTGEYDFLAGYGASFDNGESAASNLVAFDVNADGTARLVKIAGRESPPAP
jgi:hypothetical protein